MKISKVQKEKFYEWFINYFKIILISTLVILILLFSLFLLWPKYQQVKAEGVWRIKQKQEELEEKTHYLNNLKVLKKNFSIKSL